LFAAGFGGARPFNYFVFGTAVSEVELDTLTGDWQLLRSDIVMDVGNPINPAIDIGQVNKGHGRINAGNRTAIVISMIQPPRYTNMHCSTGLCWAWV
jgi:hypothetical protein